MPPPSNPYDEVPYQSYPVEWSAPERLALASMLHGGPRPRLDEYRVLELGCADGTNLIPMAYYRPHATFVGVDGAHSQIAIAQGKQAALGLSNVGFVASSFESAAAAVPGQFDFIIAHGVFSWISSEARRAVLELCGQRLRPGGLLYVNYNARPGWNVRGLIREFLLAQTAAIAGLRARAERAREIAVRMADELRGATHPYSQLLASEFAFVGVNPLSHTAHEYLSVFNDAYARRDFLDAALEHELAYVADADFNYASGRMPAGSSAQLARLDLVGESLDDASDLLYYRQLHSPILTHRGMERRAPDLEELSALSIASRLVERTPPGGPVVAAFEDPAGHQVEVRTESIASVLRALQNRWPRGLRLGSVFGDVGAVIDDLQLLYRTGMVELRLGEGDEAEPDASALHRLERPGGYTTARSHAVTYLRTDEAPGQP